MVEHFTLTKEDYIRAEANGISRSTADFRAYMLHWDKERTLTQKPHERLIPDEILQLAKDNGVEYHTLRGRIKRGEDPVKAATDPPMDKKKKVQLSLKGRRRIPEDIKQLAEANGVKYNTLYYRIVKLEMDPVEAATIKALTHSEIGKLSKHKREPNFTKK